MNEQSSIHDAEPSDRREQRLADPSRPGSWVAGVILIGLGIIFLMRNLGTYEFPFKNWWALFILIPAIGAFDTALRTYRNAGNQLDAAARGSLLVGTVLTIITGMFLFNISRTFFGPVLIILVGLGIIFNTMVGSQE